MGTDERVERRLAAVLAADVVAYSRLMGQDEARTLASLRALRSEVVNPKIEDHRGRIVKLMGDGALVEFPSVVEATQCAVETQRAMAAHNSAAPEEWRIELRIGINVGDIIVDGEDIHGDGVNVAARMESLADPGGICISGGAFEQVQDKLPLRFEDLGMVEVKNILRPVHVYRVLPDETEGTASVSIASSKRPVFKPLVVAAAVAAALAAGGALWWQPWAPQAPVRAVLPLTEKPAIAVLRFENMSSDPEQDHFAICTTESITTDLARIKDLFVISRTAATAIDAGTDPKEVGRELGVRYVLEGSVQRSGERVRVNAQLIDAETGGHISAQRYDGSPYDLLAVQDKIVRKIVSALAVKLTADEEQQIVAKETRNIEAYEKLTHALVHYRIRRPGDTETAIAELEKAIELDPDYGRAHANLARIFWDITNANWHLATEYQWGTAFEKLRAHLSRAMEHPTVETYVLSAEMRVYQGRYDEALEQINHAIEIDTSSAEAVLGKATILNVMGRASDAEDTVRLAMRLNPKYGPNYNRVLARSLFHQKRYAEAAELLEEVAKREPHEHDFVTLASAYGHLGRIDAAAAHVGNYNKVMGTSGYNALTVQEAGLWWYGDMYFYDRTYRTDLLDGLRKAGVPEGAGREVPESTYLALITRKDGLSAVRGVVEIDTKTVKAFSDRGVLVVDVRDDGSFARGHIPGAVNLELTTELDEQALLQHMEKDDAVIFHCHNKYCPYSAYAAAKAVTWGFTRVYPYAAGFPEWVAAGYPVEHEPGF